MINNFEVQVDYTEFAKKQKKMFSFASELVGDKTLNDVKRKTRIKVASLAAPDLGLRPVPLRKFVYAPKRTPALVIFSTGIPVDHFPHSQNDRGVVFNAHGNLFKKSAFINTFRKDRKTVYSRTGRRRSDGRETLRRERTNALGRWMQDNFDNKVSSFIFAEFSRKFDKNFKDL
jgi:hypothetical protein